MISPRIMWGENLMAKHRVRPSRVMAGLRRKKRSWDARNIDDEHRNIAPLVENPVLFLTFKQNDQKRYCEHAFKLRLCSFASVYHCNRILWNNFELLSITYLHNNILAIVVLPFFIFQFLFQ